MSKKRTKQVIQNVGRRVGELRKKLSLTQELLAEKAGVSVNYIRLIERGQQNLTIESLVRLADLLNCSITDFFSSPKHPKPSPGRPRKR